MALDAEEGWSPFWEDDDDDDAVWDWSRGRVAEAKGAPQASPGAGDLACQSEAAQPGPTSDALPSEVEAAEPSGWVWDDADADDDDDDGESVFEALLASGAVAHAEFEAGVNQLGHIEVEVGRSDRERRVVRQVRAFAQERGLHDPALLEVMEGLASLSGNPNATLRAVGALVRDGGADAWEVEAVAAMREELKEAEAGVWQGQGLSWGDGLALLRALPDVPDAEVACDWALDMLRLWREARAESARRMRDGRLAWDRFGQRPLNFARFALEQIEATPDPLHPHDWLHASGSWESGWDGPTFSDDEDAPSAEAVRRARRLMGT